MIILSANVIYQTNVDFGLFYKKLILIFILNSTRKQNKKKRFHLQQFNVHQVKNTSQKS